MSLCDLNANLTCKLCHGYLINAFTIIDCFHSFCKSCIIKHLETTNKCAKCNCEVVNLKEDKTLQRLVYKIVPSLYRNERERRLNFYKLHPQDKVNDELREEIKFWSPNESIDISIEFLSSELTDKNDLIDNSLKTESTVQPIKSNAKRRYLRVECAMKISHLKKWICHKMDVPSTCPVVILFDNQILSDSSKMIDLAYAYSERKCPLNLYFYYNGKRKISSNLKTSNFNKLVKKNKKAKLKSSTFAKKTIKIKNSKDVKVKKEATDNHLSNGHETNGFDQDVRLLTVNGNEITEMNQTRNKNRNSDNKLTHTLKRTIINRKIYIDWIRNNYSYSTGGWIAKEKAIQNFCKQFSKFDSKKSDLIIKFFKKAFPDADIETHSSKDYFSLVWSGRSSITIDYVDSSNANDNNIKIQQINPCNITSRLTANERHTNDLGTTNGNRTNHKRSLTASSEDLNSVLKKSSQLQSIKQN